MQASGLLATEWCQEELSDIGGAEGRMAHRSGRQVRQGSHTHQLLKLLLWDNDGVQAHPTKLPFNG